MSITTGTEAEFSGHLGEGGVPRKSIRERLSQIRPYTAEIVELAEWDITIEVRSLNLGERNAMLADAVKDGKESADMTVLYPLIIIATCYDPETGDKVFSEEDQGFVQSMPAHLADKLALTAMEISGMGEKSIDDEAKKSSETVDSEQSSS